MKIKCDNCGFEDIPENFRVMERIEDELVMIYIDCPACDNRAFFQHVSIKGTEEMIENKDNEYKMMIGCDSHLFTIGMPKDATNEELKTNAEKRRKELRIKYSKTEVI